MCSGHSYFPADLLRAEREEWVPDAGQAQWWVLESSWLNGWAQTPCRSPPLIKCIQLQNLPLLCVCKKEEEEEQVMAGLIYQGKWWLCFEWASACLPGKSESLPLTGEAATQDLRYTEPGQQVKYLVFLSSTALSTDCSSLSVFINWLFASNPNTVSGEGVALDKLW